MEEFCLKLVTLLLHGNNAGVVVLKAAAAFAAATVRSRGRGCHKPALNLEGDFACKIFRNYRQMQSSQLRSQMGGGCPLIQWKN